MGQRTGWGRLRGAGAVLVIAGLAFSTTQAPAASATPPAPQPAISPTVAERPPVMIVLDASGSMNQADAPGPRIDAAKKAVNALIATMPADTKVGLQVFGTKIGSTDAEKAAGCADIVTLATVGKLDRAGLTAKVAGITASGYTPIGNALRAAAEALPNEGPRSIVLVSDGEDTCAPPEPCDVAKELKQQGIDLVVHTIGFKVDGVARGQLSCIATATGGTYADAADATELEAELNQGFERAATKYAPKGTPIKGSAYPDGDAPLLTPGQYLDSFPGEKDAGATKYYRIAVKAGVTPWISATAIGVAGLKSASLDINVELVDVRGQTCLPNGWNADYDSGNESDAPPVSNAVLNGVPYGDDSWYSWCEDLDEIYVKISRGGTHAANQKLPVEITFREEPAGNVTGLPAAATKPTDVPLPIAKGTGVAVAGAADFNSAPVLAPGVYSDSLVSQESRFYKVPVQWGQFLAVRVDGQVVGTGRDTARARVDLYSPMRKHLNAVAIQDMTGTMGATESRLIGTSTKYPARYLNRLGSSNARAFSLDGYYYVRVSLGKTIALTPKSISVPIRMTIGLAGKVEPGPTYDAPKSKGGNADAQVSGQTPSTATESAAPGSVQPPTTATPTTDVATTSAATPTSGDGETATSSPTTAPSAAAATSSGPVTAPIKNLADATDSELPPWVWGAGAGLIVLAIGGFVIALRNRGRSQRPGQ